MKIDIPNEIRQISLSILLLLLLGTPFMFFVVVNSFRSSSSEVEDHGSFGEGNYSVSSQPSKTVYAPTEKEVFDYFFEKNKTDARLNFIVETYSKSPLSVESVKGIVNDFQTLIGDASFQSAKQLLIEEHASKDTESPQLTEEAKPEPMVPASKENPWYLNASSRGFFSLTRVAIFSASALFGGLGALMSIVTRSGGQSIKGRGIYEILSLQLVGAVFACLLTLVFAGGLVAGVLFPECHNSGNNGWFTVIFLHTQFSKLLVWSFLAGFSERLIPDLFSSLTAKFKNETTKDSK